ncbi:unnamed protein product [Sphagnum balticum]
MFQGDVGDKRKGQGLPQQQGYYGMEVKQMMPMQMGYPMYPGHMYPPYMPPPQYYSQPMYYDMGPGYGYPPPAKGPE